MTRRTSTTTRNSALQQYNIEALERGLNVLRLFDAEHPTLSFAEIVETLQATKSTAYRVLATLEASGYIQKDGNSRRYRPGIKVLQLGFTALNQLEVRQTARPHLERLAQTFTETSSLAVRDGRDITYVDRVRNRAIVGILLGVGSRAPGHCTALGKVLLAYLEPSYARELLTEVPLKALTPNTIVDPDKLMEELARTRTRGFAINNEEFAMGLRTIAAPIRDGSNAVIAAIGVSGPVGTLSVERLEREVAPTICDAADQISRELGANRDL